LWLLLWIESCSTQAARAAVIAVGQIRQRVHALVQRMALVQRVALVQQRGAPAQTPFA
jgi:hypothetical protein